jgi:carboxymethylenebutenolidase
MKTILSFIALALCLSPIANAQDWAKERLDKSPRHLEWVKVKNGEREVNCFIAFPEVSNKAPAVIVIHEIFGLTDWVRGVADQLADAGYIAIAPDYLTGTPGAAGGDGARGAIGALQQAQIIADTKAAVEYVSKLPACNGKVVVSGFCWGGRQTFRYATEDSSIKAAFVFYGDAPTSEAEIRKIACPVYGFYGENDARVNAGIDPAKELMSKAGKTYEPVIYDGAGHGFMRAGEDPNGNAANKAAREKGWARWKELLGKL